MITQFYNPNHIVVFIILSVIMGAIHRRVASSGSLLVILYCLPFTLMHEIAHVVAALLTGGRPSSFSVWPKRTGQGWILGSVISTPTILSAVPTALAPLGWLLVGYYAMVSWPLRPVWMPEYLIVVIVYACSAACTPSWQDIKVVLTHPLSLIVWGGVAYVAIRVTVCGS